MRILIVDDESLARERIIRLIQEQLSDHEIVGEAKNGLEALEKIQLLRPDVVILDIRMPGMDGLEVARHLMALETSPAVIFSTAYDEHAIDAFKVNAIDYLLKPVRAEQLKQALQKATRPNKTQLISLTKERGDQEHHARTAICTVIRGDLMLIPVEEIYYFKADRKYVTVRCKAGEFLVEEPIKELEDEFSDRFIRVHRGGLVAKQYIRGLEKSAEGLFMIGFFEISEKTEVSRRYLSSVRALLLR